MNFCIIMGSPRLHCNTAELCKPFIETLERNNAQVLYLTLSDRRIAPCKGCYACQDIGGEYGCVQQDDMYDIAQSLIWADCIVLATPIYTWYCTGEMKAMLDRCYGMNKYYGAASGSLWEGKAVAIIATHGYDRQYATTPFETGIKSLCEHSKLRYLGLYSERDVANIASFQTPTAIQGAKEFALRLLGML